MGYKEGMDDLERELEKLERASEDNEVKINELVEENRKTQEKINLLDYLKRRFECDDCVDTGGGSKV